MNDRRLVHTSETGMRSSGSFNAPPKGKPQPKQKAQPVLPDDGFVRIFREKGGRGGKTVTVLRGMPDKGPALEGRMGELKRLCGAGGTLRDGAIEIQGDHRERIAEKLTSWGYKVKLAGG